MEVSLFKAKTLTVGVPPKLSGFVCAFHPATPGSNPKHTIYAFFNLNLNLSCDMLKRRK